MTCLLTATDYDDTLSTLPDKHAPRRAVRRRHQPTTPWFDSDCAAAKRRARTFERRTAALVQLLTAVRGLARCDVNSDSVPGK